MKAFEPHKKIAIIGGAGTVGSALAFYLCTHGIVDEIVLIDVNDRGLSAHVMDIEQAASALSTTRIKAGTYDDLVGATIVVVACSMRDTGGSDRSTYLKENVSLVREIARRIKEHSPGAVIITVTNPVDVLNYVMWKETGADRAQCIGFSLNDTLRFRWAIANVLHVPPMDVYALVVGEHGPHQVPLFSSITVRGEPVSLHDSERSKIDDQVHRWFQRYISLKSGRTSGWTSAVGTAKLVEQILVGSDEVVAASVVPADEYGLTGLSISLPIRAGSDGVKKIVSLLLTETETTALQRASEEIKRAIGAVKH